MAKRKRRRRRARRGVVAAIKRRLRRGKGRRRTRSGTVRSGRRKYAYAAVKRRKGRKTRRVRVGRFTALVNPRRGRRNPISDIVDTLKAAAPVAVAYFGGRILSAKITDLVGSKLPGGLAAHARPLVAVGLVAAGAMATKKVPMLFKHRVPIMVGLGLNALDTLIRSYAPASVKAAIGVGDDGIYDEALSDYVETAGDLGDYVETQGYNESVFADAEEELADYLETGSI